MFDLVWSTTGGPSSSCEMIILRNKSHGEVLRVCMGILTTVLRNEKYGQFLNKNTSPNFHSALLAIWPLTILKRPHFGELSISKFTTYKRKALLRAIHPKVCSKVAQKLPPKFKKVAYFWESFCSRLLLKTWRCICNLTSFVVINIIFKLNITNNRKYFLMTFPMSKHHNVCYRHHSADDQQLLYYNCPMWKCVTVGCPPC